MPYDSKYKPNASGVSLAFMTLSEEDDVFHADAKNSLFVQSWEKYAISKHCNLNLQTSEETLGRTSTTVPPKNCDFIRQIFVLQNFLGIKPNTASGVTDSMYVNAVALRSIEMFEVKTGTLPLFRWNGMVLFLLLELYGLLDHYAEHIGYCKTRAELSRQSKQDHWYAAPCIAFPGHRRTDQALNMNGFSYNSPTFHLKTRRPDELFYNVSSSSSALTVAPIVISTGKAFDEKSVQMGISIEAYWISGAERDAIAKPYREVIYPEYGIAGSREIAPAAKLQKEDIPLEMKGPVKWVALVLQSESDIKSGAWTKFGPSSGDYISEAMLYTGSVEREDGLPAPMLRGARLVEVFKVNPKRQIYIFSFEEDDTNPQMTGHQTMSNLDKLKMQAWVQPHDDTLVASVYYSAYQGWYTELGHGGSVWNLAPLQ